jgi:nicotinate-nucleotide pyrophosphorylase (carboxylating)
MYGPLSNEEQIDGIIDLALAEDLGHGDITTQALIPPNLEGKASITIKEAGVLAGIEVAKKVFLRVEPSLKVTVLIKDGATVRPGDTVATLSGPAMGILKAERTALNFLQRLSGIASQTARYVARSKGLPAAIIDTRKTTPGLRALEKYAVRMGGGRNHRLHLGDGILIKDNHLAALRGLGMSLKEIIARAKQNAPKGTKVEVEVDTVPEAEEALATGADIIMLDNMSPGEMRQVVSSLPDGVETEASGGITLTNLRQAAQAGVNFISIGALTHSPQALDVSLDFEATSLRLM